MKLAQLILSTISAFLFLANTSLQSQQLDHVLGEFLIRVSPETEVNDFVSRQSVFQGKTTNFKAVELLSSQVRIWKFSFDFSTINERYFKEHLYRQPEVEVIQFNHLLTDRQTIPNDTEFGTQWQWMNTGQSGGLEDADVDAELAWDIATGGVTANGDTIVVAVVDDGIDLTHPDLTDNLWVNDAEIPDNGIDDDDNGYIDDYFGWDLFLGTDDVGFGFHGVEVAGMIGGVGGNMLQGTGINWNVKIMTIVRGGIDEATVIASYSYALGFRQLYNETNGAEGAFVVATNSSWGIDAGNPDDAPLWCAFYDTLGVHGILSCGATANIDWNIDEVGDLPTACPSEYLLSVTATNDMDMRTFSAFGPIHVDLGAPGEDVYTTLTGGGYTFTSGTSFASPLTAGVIALLYSAPCTNLADLALAAPDLAALQVRDYIFQGVDPVAQLENEVATGGRINAHNSILKVLENCGPCPPPGAISAENVTDVLAAITFFTTDSVQTVNFRWRPEGSETWNDLFDVQSPVLLTNLEACLNYEVQLESICADTMSGFSNSFVFMTDGCCVAPDDLAIVEVEEESVTVEWSSILAANTYTVQIKEVAGNEWIPVTSDTTILTIDNLIPCTDYELEIQSVCDTGSTAYASNLLFTTFGCGACTDFDYCPSAGLFNDSEWIEQVSIGDIDNLSGLDPNGYGNYTHLSTELVINTTYDITLVPGFPGFAFLEYFKVWIDYNQNGDFEEPDEIVFEPGFETDMPVSGEITIPNDAPAGFTRMRVSMKYLGGFDPAPLPCEEEFTFGEVEDYCVTIIDSGPQVPCIVSPELDTIAVGFLDAQLEWEAIGGAIAYHVRHKPFVLDGEWEEQSVIEPTLALDGLEECTAYEFQVKSICAIDTSSYSESFLFNTRCSTNAEEIYNENSVSIYPNPFVDDIFIDVDLNKSQDVEIEVLNTAGQVQHYKKYPTLQAGQNRLQVNLSDFLISGIYFVKIELKEGVIVKKVIKK